MVAGEILATHLTSTQWQNCCQKEQSKYIYNERE